MLVHTANFQFSHLEPALRPSYSIRSEVYWGDNCEFRGKVLAVAHATPEEFNESGEAASGTALIFVNSAIGTRRYIYQIHLLPKSVGHQEYVLAWVDEGLLVPQEDGVRFRRELDSHQGLENIGLILGRYAPEFKINDSVEFEIHSPVTPGNYVLFRDRGMIEGIESFSTFLELKTHANSLRELFYSLDFLPGYYYRVHEIDGSYVAWLPEAILKASPIYEESLEAQREGYWGHNLTNWDSFAQGVENLIAHSDPSIEKEELAPLFSANDWAVTPIEPEDEPIEYSSEDSNEDDVEFLDAEEISSALEEEVIIRDFMYLDGRLETYRCLLYFQDGEDYGVRWEAIHDAEYTHGITGWIYLVEPAPIGRLDYSYWTTESELTLIAEATELPKGETYNALLALDEEIQKERAVFDMSIQLPLSMCELFKDSHLVPFV
jgi:hypothetical protein